MSVMGAGSRRRTRTSAVSSSDPHRGSRTTPRSPGDGLDDLDDRVRQAEADDHRRRRATTRDEVHRATSRGRPRGRWSRRTRSAAGSVSFMPSTSHRAPRGAGVPGRRAAQGPLKSPRSQGGDAVPHPRFGHDQPAERAVRVDRRDLSTDLADVDVDVVRLVAVRRPPHRAQEPSVRDQAAVVRERGPSGPRTRAASGGPVGRSTVTSRRPTSMVRSPTRTSPDVSAAGPAARRRSASILARISAMPNGFVT